MEFRFLFVDTQGEEIYVPSLEDLARFVRSGILQEEMLLYDARTREWAPARSHPAFPRGSQDSGAAVESEDPSARGSAEASRGTAAPLRLDEVLPGLAPIPEDQSTLDPVKAFLEDQEREREEESREHDRDLQTAPFLAGRDAGDGLLDSGLAVGWGDTPPEPGDPGYSSFHAAGVEGDPGDEGGVPVDAAHEPPSAGPDPADTARELRAGVRRSGWQGRRRKARSAASNGIVRWARRTRARDRQRSREAAPRQAALFILLMAVGGWGIADAWGVSPLEATDLGGRMAHAAAQASSPLVPTMEAAKSGAFDDMVRVMEVLRAEMQVDEPPESWMGGPYVADARAYPDVRGFWVRYLEYVDLLRSQEEDLFRSGFVARLQAQGISGPVLSIRLARALRDFRADRPRRNQTYGAMAELGSSSIDLHDFLVDNAEGIDYAPVDQGVTDDPILEAVPVDESTREELWRRIAVMVDALDRVAGQDPLQRRDVSLRVLGDLAIPDPAAGS